MNDRFTTKTVRIITVSIAILILTAIAIPILNSTPARAADDITLKRGTMDVIQSPFKLTRITTEKHFDPGMVLQVGIDDIGGNKYTWAAVLVPGPSKDNPAYTQYFYIPTHRMQTLFEAGLLEGGLISIDAKMISAPEGVELVEGTSLYEVISAKVYKSWV